MLMLVLMLDHPVSAVHIQCDILTASVHCEFVTQLLVMDFDLVHLWIETHRGLFECL